MRLTPTEWHLLEILLRNPGKLVSQRQLLQEVWGPQYRTETNYLRQYMAQLRRKLEADPAHPRHLLTEPGMGYGYGPRRTRVSRMRRYSGCTRRHRVKHREAQRDRGRISSMFVLSDRSIVDHRRSSTAGPDPGASRDRQGLVLAASTPGAARRPYCRGMPSWLGRDRSAYLLAVALPLAVAAALTPFRDRVENTHVALILVATVVAVAAIGNRVAGYLAALLAGVWFDFFFTEPFSA